MRGQLEVVKSPDRNIIHLYDVSGWQLAFSCGQLEVVKSPDLFVYLYDTPG